MTNEALHERGLAAAKAWRLANGIRDNSGGLSTMGSYKAYGLAVAAAAFEEGVLAGAQQSDDEWRQKRKVREAVNPYAALPGTDKENPE